MLATLGLFILCASQARGATSLGPWVPVFRGVDHAVGTNFPGTGSFSVLQVAHCLRVDLTDPDIRLYATPRYTNYSVGYNEAAGYTVTNFLRLHNLQVAINANRFDLPGSTASPPYTLPEGSALNPSGLVISEGLVVSPQTSSVDSSLFLFGTNNTATFVKTNWPAVSNLGIYTAVAGLYVILANGVNIGSNYINSGASIHGLDPPTLIGVSQDKRYLYLLVIDGRQSGYSDGAYDWEAAAWLLLAGAWDGVNLDGGGSTCMAIMDSTGHPLPLNRDTASRANGRERTVGAHFGLYAAPLLGFFTNMQALADDTAATITWTTLSPATTQVKYGLTTNLTLSSALNSELATNHAVLLTNLTPGTEYFFAALGDTTTNLNISPTFSFSTTNYLITNALFDLTNVWRYTTTNLDGVAWTTREYDDSGWDSEGPGLLWTDDRGPNAEIPVPMLTEMPGNPATGFPYRTYYFRTHFTLTNAIAGAVLDCLDYIDDGAVFYLNGREIYRLRMAAAPTVIYNSTLAIGYACSGNASCPHTFTVSGPLITTNLVVGDNVLSVEVHNYNAGSPDITFGLSALLNEAYVLSPTLNLTGAESGVTLSWERGGFILQQADSPTGIWSDVPGPIISSPFTTTNSSSARFFRLHR